MAAEFAAATGAAGLVSLGLQVCGGLIKYYGDLKSQDDDVDSVISRIEGLANTLEVLSAIIPSSDYDQTPAATQVEKSVVSCGAGIRKLESALKNYDSRRTRFGGSSAQLRRALYPFRKAELVALNTTLSDLQLNLMAAIQVYDLSSRRDQRQEDLAVAGIGRMILQSIQSDVSSLAAASEQMPRLQDIMEDMPNRVLERVQTIHLELATRPTTRERLQRAACAMLRNDDESKMDRLSNYGHVGPFAWDSDSLPSTDRTHDSNTVTEIQRKPYRSICQCRPSNSRRSVSLLGLLDFHSDTSAHTSSCPFYNVTGSSSEYSIRARYPWPSSSQVTGAYITLKITKGVGATVLGRNLLCRRIVRFDDPLIALPLPNYMTHFKIENVINLRKQMCCLLTQGLLFPTDVDANGVTLLMYICSIIRRALSEDLHVVTQCRLLIGEVIDSGALVKETDFHDQSAMSYLAVSSPGEFHPSLKTSTAQSQICLDLIRRGAEVSDFLDYRILKTSSELLEEAQISKLGRALLNRSIPELHEALSSHPGCIVETFTMTGNQGHSHGTIRSPFNLAVDWPDGLRLLLRTGPEVAALDLSSNLLADAIFVRNFESASALIGLNYPIRDANILLSSANKLRPIHVCKRWTKLLVAGLVDRRKRLQKLTQLNLVPNDYASLDFSNGALLDAQASMAIELLKQKDVEIPTTLHIGSDYESAYNFRLDTAIADLLWDNGFRDLGRLGYGYRNPLNYLFLSCIASDGMREDLAITSWAISHGIFQRMSKATKSRQLLALAQRFGAKVGGCHMWENEHEMRTPLLYGLHLETQRFLLDWFYEDFDDTCQCYCSIKACTALSATFKGLFWGLGQTLYLGGDPFEHNSQAKNRTVQRILEFFRELFELAVGNSHLLIPQLLRVLTFESLEMRHTCHGYSYYYDEQWQRHHRRFDHSEPRFTFVDQEEIQEIHDEDAVGIVIFESLVTELTETFWISGMSLIDFFNGPYLRRINEALAAEVRIDLESVRAIEHLGVRLHLDLHRGNLENTGEESG